MAACVYMAMTANVKAMMVTITFLELLEFQTLSYGHTIHVNLQGVYLQIYFFFLQHLCIEQVTKRCFRLMIANYIFHGSIAREKLLI